MEPELFVKEMKIFWQNIDVEKRTVFADLLREYFGEERGYKLIEQMQEGY